MRRVFFVISLILLTATALPARRLRVVYRGNLPSVMVEINGQERGELFRDEPRVFRVRRRRAVIRLSRGEMTFRKRLTLSPDGIRTVVFSRPSFRGVILRLEGRYPWARVYVNGRRRGRVYRDQPRYLPLRPGRVYRIQAMRRALIRGSFRVRVARSGARAVRRITFDF